MNKNVKKTGLIVGGVVAALVAVSPVAFAGDKHHDRHGPEKVCAFQGGDGGAASAIPGNSLANVVAQVPISGNNILNAGNCSEFLNNNLNDNVQGNVIDLL